MAYEDHNSSAVHRSRAGGFTLLELMVVGLLGVMLITMMATMWSWLGVSVVQQQTGDQFSRELKMAADAIAQDFGSAVGARTLDTYTLQICHDGVEYNETADWASPDTVIEYGIANGRLIRTDTATNEELVIARHFDDFRIEDDNGVPVVTMRLLRRGIERELLLRLETRQ